MASSMLLWDGSGVPQNGLCVKPLLIHGGFDLCFDCPSQTPMLFMLHVRPERQSDFVERENFTTYPQVPFDTYVDGFGNICARLIAPPGRLSLRNRFVIADGGEPETLPIHARQHPVGELPADALVYLLGSRYCDTQKLSDRAWQLFGGYPEGWPRLQAIVQYTHDRIRFSYSHARNDRTAWEADCEGTGVCRDYAHLAIALCRCMNIPARYCTGYLGDIGVPRDPAPMDFSAWFEAYMGGAWHALDARHNQPRIGRILIAQGRDAADVAISTSFGPAVLARFLVITEQVG